MPEPVRTVDQDNEIERARQFARFRTLRDAFVELFGPPGKRTPQGAVVLSELERFCGNRKLISELTTDGATDLYRTARKHGRCDVIQAINDLIEWREGDSNANSSGNP